ncbi:MAG: DUF3365 domain-containing protein [Nitrospira defluvii]|nr:DUF3365 domain-containing protein [Nitrospira defluvii]
MTACLTLVGGLAKAGQAADLPGIPPEVVADYLHAVIEADRIFYTIHVVERMQKQGGTPASETWRRDKITLPLPAQFLREASELATLTGTKVRYRLISLWPINPQNAPASDSERSNLEAVRQHPERSATGIVRIGEQSYFQAVYADRAVTQACIGCHNAHPRSSKKDFRLDDVMGGLVIEIPLEQ